MSSLREARGWWRDRSTWGGGAVHHRLPQLRAAEEARHAGGVHAAVLDDAQGVVAAAHGVDGLLGGVEGIHDHVHEVAVAGLLVDELHYRLVCHGVVVQGDPEGEDIRGLGAVVVALLKGLYTGEDGLDVAHEFMPLFGQLHPAAAPLEDDDGQLILQLFQLPAQVGGGDIVDLRRLVDGFAVRNLNRIFHLLY